MFFFFFYNQGLYFNPIIQEAFGKVCINKMLQDGYIDMNMFIKGTLKKEELCAQLIKENSKYRVLFQHPYPKQENVESDLKRMFNTCSDISNMSDIEAKAIVYWIYRIMRNQKERLQFTKDFFSKIKSLYFISNFIKYSNGVFYNSERVEVEFFNSISEINKFLNKIEKKDSLFFRGHTNLNYQLRPSVMREKEWIHQESDMYNEVLINCPGDFEHCKYYIEKLVKMQHYGLPTRLLDITKNPLVALYFACRNEFEMQGELVMLSAKKEEILFPQDDLVSILSNLSMLSYTEKEYLKNSTENELNNSYAMRNLMKEIYREQPSVEININKDKLFQNCVVLAAKNNERIIKQDGAFILCGLDCDKINSFRYKENGKMQIIVLKNKLKILQELEEFSINRATMFPEIENISIYIREKYLRNRTSSK